MLFPYYFVLGYISNILTGMLGVLYMNSFRLQYILWQMHVFSVSLNHGCLNKGRYNCDHYSMCSPVYNWIVCPPFEGFIHMRKVTSLWKICICSFLKAKLLGMGWKRDSNPFNGPKWENCCNRDLFGHLKVKCSVNNPVHFIWCHQ